MLVVHFDCCSVGTRMINSRLYMTNIGIATAVCIFPQESPSSSC
uniref:Uncharacterized protein n=1 Tax=Manihot esculenta TaxID=3983 RepID=A0A2C9U4S5_MANES